MTPLLAFLIAVLFIATAVWMNWDQIQNQRTSELRVREFLKNQGYTVIATKRSYFNPGPFPSSAANKAPVFKVLLRDSGGSECNGWVVCPLSPGQIEMQIIQ